MCFDFSDKLPIHCFDGFSRFDVIIFWEPSFTTPKIHFHQVLGSCKFCYVFEYVLVAKCLLKAAVRKKYCEKQYGPCSLGLRRDIIKMVGFL